jgi:hypothetical protein
MILVFVVKGKLWALCSHNLLGACMKFVSSRALSIRTTCFVPVKTFNRPAVQNV